MVKYYFSFHGWKFVIPEKIPEAPPRERKEKPEKIPEPKLQRVALNSFPKVHKKRFGFNRRKII